MCRLYGFRSVIDSQVHRSLVNADNALAAQSERHPDGWGVAYYIDDAPHVTRSASTALHDTLFKRVSGVVSSQTVLAHIRKATQGEQTVLNCHPFQYGRWVFAHNGDIPNFSSCREALEAEISPRLRRFILGDTDSERIFFLFLTKLERHGRLSSNFGVEAVSQVLQETVEAVREVCDEEGAEKKALLTLMAKLWPVAFTRASLTLPKVPKPIICMSSSSSSECTLTTCASSNDAALTFRTAGFFSSTAASSASPGF